MKEFIFSNIKNDLEYHKNIEYLYTYGWKIIKTEPIDEKSIKIYVRKNCNECKFINISEQEQQDKNNNIGHECIKYNKKLFHKCSNPKEKHSYIHPCLECGDKDFEYSYTRILF